MLDEIREYEQYTMDVNKFGSPDSGDVRLKFFSLIKKNFSGLARAMTVIARYHMFPDGVMTDKFDADRVQAVLRAWCGFNYKDEYASYASYIEENKLDNWLDRYIRTVFLAPALEQCGNPLDDVVKEFNESGNNQQIENAAQLPLDLLLKQTDILKSLEKSSKAKKDEAAKNVAKEAAKKDKNNEKVLGDLEALKAKYEREESGANQSFHTISALQKLHTGFRYMGTRMFVPEYKPIDTSAKGNDYKRITFENIIANAFSMGPLKRYYLVCENKNFWELIGKYTAGKTDNAKQLSKSDKDLILKVTAACLLQAQFQQHGQEFVAINQMDLANWLCEKAAPEKFGLEKIKLILQIQ